MTEFARLTAIFSEDLIASLGAFQTQVRESGRELHEDLQKALNHLPQETVGSELYRVIGDHRNAVERDTTSRLAIVQLVLNDMEDFLQKCLLDARPMGETKLLFKSILDWFLTHSERIKGVVFSPAMDHWAISTHVPTALSALQSLATYSFTRVLSETAQHLGLVHPPGEGEQPVIQGRVGAIPVEPREVGMQLWAIICSKMESEQLGQPSWYKPRALHLDNSEGFAMRRPDDISPVLIPTLFDNMEVEIAQLKKLKATVPDVGTPVLGVKELWKELCDTPSEDRKAKFQAILQSYQEP